MTICYEGAISTSAVGGAIHHFDGMASALQAHYGEELQIVVPRFLGDEAFRLSHPGSARVTRIPTFRRSLFGHSLYEVGKLLWILRTRAGDVRRGRSTTVVSRISPIGVTPFLTRLFGVRTVIEVNGLPNSEFASRGFSPAIVFLVRTVTQLQLRSSIGAVAVTEGIARHVRTFGVKSVLVLENAVDVLQIFPRTRSDVRSTRSRIGFSGAFAPWVEFEVLLRAFDVLRRQDPERSWRLQLIGDGDERDFIERLVVELGLSDLVAITGWCGRDEAMDLLSGNDVAVAPLRPKAGTDTCGSPLKIYEYLALGLRVVASDVDGIVDIGPYPISLYEQGNADSLALAIRASADLLPMGADELRAVRETVSWNSRASTLSQWLDDLQEGPATISAVPQHPK